MQMHIYDKAYLLIDSYLPKAYSEEAQKRLSEIDLKVNIEIIQSVRNKRGKRNKDFNQVLNVLVEIARENEIILKSISSNTDNP